MLGFALDDLGNWLFGPLSRVILVDARNDCFTVIALPWIEAVLKLDALAKGRSLVNGLYRLTMVAITYRGCRARTGQTRFQLDLNAHV